MMKKRLTAAIAVLCLILTLLPLNVWAAEETEDAVTWRYDEGTDTLTISGTGEMGEYGGPDIVTAHKIKHVVIEPGITSITENVFSVWNITSVSIPDTVTTIGADAFYSCKALTSIIIPDSVTAIGPRAFSVCHGLTSILIPDAITTIAEEAFSGCINLSEVHLPSKLEAIGKGAFTNCASLTDITLPNSLKIIEPDAFSSTSLTRLVIPEGVTKIGKDALSIGTLSALYIPASVTEIHYDALSLDRNMRDIYYGGTQEQWKALGGSSVVYNTAADEPLLVHYNSSPKLPEISAGDEETLQKRINDGINAGASLIDIQLTADIDLTQTLSIPQGPELGKRTGEVRIDLNGHTITSAAGPAVSVNGTLTVQDTTAADPPVVGNINDSDPVTYRSGAIRTSTGGKSTAIDVQQGGRFFLESGKIEASNIGIRVRGGKAEVNGGYVESVESAVAVLGEGATAWLRDGVLLSRDNAVIAGNGLPEYAGTSIQIFGGTLISKSTTDGYIPCGIYHPQDGSLSILSGTIHAENGVGILMRGGFLRVSVPSTDQPPEIIAAGTGEGYVGDLKQAVPSGHPIVVDQRSGYYDYAQITYQKEAVTLADSLKDEYEPHLLASSGYELKSKAAPNSSDQPSELYYLWKVGAFKIRLDGNGGTGAILEGGGQLTVDGKITNTNCWNPSDVHLKREGYTFDGWYTQLEGGEKVGPEYVFTSETTIYAHWTANSTTPTPPTEYTVTFNSQGGSAVDSQTVASGGKVTKPADPTRTGYTFGGWYKEETCTDEWNFAADTVTEDITLYAKWTPVKKNYTITLDANGGTLSGGTIATTNDDGKLTALPAAPTRSGYTFDKWTTSTGTEVTVRLVFNGDTTIYAQWKKADGSADDQTYTISFDLNYADAPDAPESISTGADHKPAKPLPAVSREGYSFDGWFTEDMEKVTDNTLFYASVTLKAQWTKNSDTTQKAPYTITLDANGGVSDIETIKTGDDGKLDTLPKAPTRSGYTFLGWYTEETGGTKITVSYAFAADTTIYARWEKDTGTSDPSGDYYHIDYPDRVTGGTFDVSHNRAREGTRITIELSPRSNYELDELEVINADTGGTIRCHERYTDEYTFTMPDSDVEIFLSYQRRDSGGGGYYVPAEPVIPMTGWYCQNGRIYTAAGELMSDRTPLTRDMLLSILYNREGGGAEGHQTWATKNGIVPNYYEGGYYGTDKPLTREQTAMILYCYARYKNYSTSQRAQLTGYSDYREIRPMAQTAMSWARGANLMTGTTSTTLSPTANLTCGQACVLLQRFAANVSWGW